MESLQVRVLCWLLICILMASVKQIQIEFQTKDITMAATVVNDLVFDTAVHICRRTPCADRLWAQCTIPSRKIITEELLLKYKNLIFLFLEMHTYIFLSIYIFHYRIKWNILACFTYATSLINLYICPEFLFSNILVLWKSRMSNLHVQISFNLVILNDNRFLFHIINVVCKRNVD